MADVLRFGMIGCGGNGRRQHLKQLVANKEAAVAALADPSAEMIALSREYVGDLPAETPEFADYREMLEKVALDAVAISTPHTLHAEQIIDCLAAGLHVLVEKPLTTTLADAHAVIEAAKAAGRQVCVAYQRRWQGMQRYMREFIRDEAFGTPHYVQSFISQGWLQGTAGSWRQDPGLSGVGQIGDTGSHLIDMIFWMMPSRPVEAAAVIDNRGAAVDIDSAISYRFADGAVGSLAILGSGPKWTFWEDMTVAGSTGRALFFRKEKLTVIVDGKEIEPPKFAPDVNPNDQFIDVIKGRAENISPPQEFLPVVAFTEACIKSAANGGANVKIEY